MYLGIQAIRHRHDFGADSQGPEPATISWSKSLRQGFVVGVSNPKSFILVAAVLPHFVDRSTGEFGLQVFLLGVILVSIALASDTVWAMLAARLRTWLSHSPRRGRLLGTVGGVSMIGLGVSVAFTVTTPGSRPTSSGPSAPPRRLAPRLASVGVSVIEASMVVTCVSEE